MEPRELALLSAFGLCWLLSMVVTVAGFPFAGMAPLGLYGLYSLAVATGWLCGNLLMTRAAGRPRRERRRLWLVYCVGPLGALYLVHTFERAELRSVVPLAPVWAFAVFLVLFLVPVSFRRERLRSRR